MRATAVLNEAAIDGRGRWKSSPGKRLLDGLFARYLVAKQVES